jgi:hypothetical protein
VLPSRQCFDALVATKDQKCRADLAVHVLSKELQLPEKMVVLDRRIHEHATVLC